MPDTRLGPFRIRRADGLPLAVLEAVSESDAGDEIGSVDFQAQPEIRMGLRLGPLPEGRLPLEVVLGGTVIARPVADVRAGKHTPISVPVRKE